MPKQAVQRRVAVVHAVQVAMSPVEAAFKRVWPDAMRFNLLDDGLPHDLERAGAITPQITDRLIALASLGVASGADGVLFTCSAFGPAIEAAAERLTVPVLKPNEPMFLAALEQGGRVGMVATFAASVASMEEEFRALAAAHGSHAQLKTVCIPEALARAKSGDIAGHNALVAQAAKELGDCDAVMLAHFSTSTALEAVEASVAVPVLTAPEAAVSRMKSLVDR